MAWTSNPSHFRVFRFLFGRGTDVHLPSQENEIQPISQQPTSVSKFIICLFRHAKTAISRNGKVAVLCISMKICDRRSV